MKMADINCPGCGEIISDRAIKCRKCRYPIGRFVSAAQEDDNTAHLMPQEFLSALSSDMTEIGPVDTVKSRKLKKMIKLIAAFLLTVAALTAVVMIFIANGSASSYEVVPVSVNELKMSRVMHLGYEDILNVYSDETKPFAAVITDKGSGENYYVFVNEGCGILDLGSGEIDPVLDGYAEGFAIPENDITVLNTERAVENTNDENTLPGTIVSADISLPQEMNGIMICSAEFYSGSNIIKNISVPVCAGRGVLTVRFPFSLYSPEESEFKLVSVFFVPAKEGSESSVSINDPSVTVIADEINDSVGMDYGEEFYADYYSDRSKNGSVCSIKASVSTQGSGNIALYSYKVDAPEGLGASGCGACILSGGSFKLMKYVYVPDSDKSSGLSVNFTPCGIIGLSKVESK